MKDISTKKQTIMIVEDEENIIILLEELLNEEGYDVVCANNIPSVKEYIYKNEPVDLILLDQPLPYQRSLELIRKIRNHMKWSHVPIVILTTKATGDFVSKALQRGANDYVEKPFDIMKLTSVVRGNVGS